MNFNGEQLIRQSWLVMTWVVLTSTASADDLSPAQLKLVQSLERQRIVAIESVVGSVIAIYDENRVGGGSGVIIDSSGVALTNHHVIMGAGVSGWGGLADGELYRWTLIGTDPGGDVAMIQMEGLDAFPCTPLADSDTVKVGDWALAMGNPFILTEDQYPTVTLGIVSGIQRYQPGAGANQLVYGNCIQVDSSINPGNSGGPLFNFHSRVIGINGRGSFQDRGRVNVGLGYAISSNQIKNFIPDLLATKLVEHGTLDASFSDRDGIVVCSTINRDAPVATAGLNLGDELLEFEGLPIENANQFTNLICTLPADWPAMLKIRPVGGEPKTIVTRLLGLPYHPPPAPRKPVPRDRDAEKDDSQGKDGEKPSPAEEQKAQRQREMFELMSAPAGEVRFPDINRRYANQIIADWQQRDGQLADDQTVAGPRVMKLVDEMTLEGNPMGKQVIWLATDGRCRIDYGPGTSPQLYLFDGERFFTGESGEELQEISLVQAKLRLPFVQAISMSAAIQESPWEILGSLLIDGSDKAMSQNAWRLSIHDRDDDKFYVWLGMYDESGLPAARLLRSAANKDCLETGGVTFGDWKSIDGWMLPMHREFVFGLSETPKMTFDNLLHQWLNDPDPNLFVPTPIVPAISSE
jgi:S1-C subfamily serine protease